MPDTFSVPVPCRLEAGCPRRRLPDHPTATRARLPPPIAPLGPRDRLLTSELQRWLIADIGPFSYHSGIQAIKYGYLRPESEGTNHVRTARFSPFTTR